MEFPIYALFTGIGVALPILTYLWLGDGKLPNFMKALTIMLVVVFLVIADVLDTFFGGPVIVQMIITAIPEPAVGAMCGCAFLAYIFLTSLRGHSGEKKNLGTVLVNGMVIAISTGAATIVFALAGTFLLTGQYALVALGLVPMAIPIVGFELRRLTLPPHRRPAFIAA